MNKIHYTIDEILDSIPHKNKIFISEQEFIDYIKELQDYKLKCEKIENNCIKSIESINKKLKDNREPYKVIDGKIIYLNDYQVLRLKCIRMKCKEILRLIRGE